MPLNLPTDAISKKNALAIDDQLYLLLDVTLPDASVVRIYDGMDAVAFGGETYNPLPLQLDDNGTGRDETPEIVIKVDNVSRALMPDIEAYDGLNGAAVTLRFVAGSNMAAGTAWIERDFQVKKCEITAEWIVFTLGARNPFTLRCPRRRILREFCAWKFKSDECGYAGAETSCNKSLARCEELANQGRFGGFPLVGKTT